MYIYIYICNSPVDFVVRGCKSLLKTWTVTFTTYLICLWKCVILRSGAVVNQWRCHETSACGQNDRQVRRDFKIIIYELSRVSLVTSNFRGSSICSPKSIYKKTSNEILAELKAAFKRNKSKFPRPRPVVPSLLWQLCLNSQLSTERKGEEGRN